MSTTRTACVLGFRHSPVRMFRTVPPAPTTASAKAYKKVWSKTCVAFSSPQNHCQSRCLCTQRCSHPALVQRRQHDRLASLTARCSSGAADPAEPDAMSNAQTTDWRQFRAHLIATDKGKQETGSRWAHNVSKAEKGCLLLAHPLMFGNTQSYFSQAVIFMFEHGEEGSAGFILNRPTELTLGKLVAADALLPEFADNLLYLGGDVGSDTMHFVHGCSDIQGAVEVVDGVYMGGFESARSAVKQGSKQADQFRWFNKYAGWGPGQLDQEVASGVWFTVAASSEVILNHETLARSKMWHDVLEMMGGDYAQLSASVKEAYPDSLPRDGS